MYPEQTSLMIEMVRSSKLFSMELSSGAKAQIWRNITQKCNAMRNARQRTVDQYKRHWYDLKMRVKNKLMRRQEAYSIPGTKQIPAHMELTEDEHYVAIFVKNMEGMDEIVEEALTKSAPPRTKEQTATMLKLVHKNKENFKKLNMTERQRIWKEIATTLNKMQGPNKTVDGWKKAYWCWRLQVGDDYEKEMERWIRRAPSEIMSTDAKETSDEFENDELHNELDEEDLQPSEAQQQRLYELVMEHRAIIRTGGNDEPLKKQIWANIADELNELPGVTLATCEWRKRGNCSKLIPKNERRKRNSSTHDVIALGTEDVSNVKFEILDAHTNGHLTQQQQQQHQENADTFSEDIQHDEDNHEYLDDATEDLSQLDYDSDHEFLYMKQENSIDDVDDDELNYEENEQDVAQKDSNEENNTTDGPKREREANTDNDDDFLDYKIKHKRFKATAPIVKSFKFTNRIVNAVEKLGADVSDMKEMLQQTTSSLANLEQSMERHNEKQDETNYLLKRNNQLLKLLVEYKTGKRKRASN